MGTRYTPAGFTIIEVMLFLAVSGVLAVAILASSSVAINTQRYRDAMNTLQSTLQSQYNQTLHVVNDRDGQTQRCDQSNGVRNSGGGMLAEPTGTSECVIMGRYIAFAADGRTMTLSNVVGYKNTLPDGTPDPLTDTEALAQYRYFIDTSVTETGEIAWSGQVDVKATNNDNIPIGANQAFRIFILRSPLTGGIRTFSAVGPATESPLQLTSMFSNLNSQTAKKLCIDPSSFTVGTKLGVLIRERASSSGAVELLTGDSGC